MKKIQAYLDCVSPYSQHAFTYLLTHRPMLKAHDVTLEVIPVFLGGIMQLSGNSPPWKLDAKAVLSTYDTERAQKSFRRIGGKFYGESVRRPGEEWRIWRTPDFFPILSVLPQRVLTHIRESYPTQIYESTFLSFFHYLWSAEPQIDLSKKENVIYALEHTHPNMSVDGIPSSPQNLKQAFTPEEIGSILEAAGSETVEAKLKETTEFCVKELGAFGCPWFWVINDERPSSSSSANSRSSQGQGGTRFRKLDRKDGGEPFFGTDRWHHIWEYLDIPLSDTRVLGAEVEGDLKRRKVLAKM